MSWPLKDFPDTLLIEILRLKYTDVSTTIYELRTTPAALRVIDYSPRNRKTLKFLTSAITKEQNIWYPLQQAAKLVSC